MSHADATVDVRFDSRGLVPVIAQDAETGQVLMFAYASAEAVSRTAETGLAHYYSRSRDELWQKGETSGHVQRVEEIRIDCDGDSVLYSVTQEGGACHTGYETCFYRSVEDVSIGDTGATSDDVTGDEPTGLTVAARIVADRVFDPDAVYE